MNATSAETGEQLLARGQLEAAMRDFRARLAAAAGETALLHRFTDALALAGHLAAAAELQGEQFDALLEAGRPREACALFTRLNWLHPQNAARWMAYARALEAGEQRGEAERAYRQAAGAYRRDGGKAAETEAWRAVFRLNPSDYSTCLEIAARAEASGDNPLAAEACAQAASLLREDLPLLARASRLAPESQPLALRHAQALMRAGRSEEARAVLDARRGPREASEDWENCADLNLLGAYCDSLLSEGRAEAAAKLLLPHLSRADWFERGLRCLHGMSREPSPAAAAFAAALEDKSGLENRHLQWVRELHLLRAEAREAGMLDFLADAFNRAGEEPAMLWILHQSLEAALGADEMERAADLLERIIATDPNDPEPGERLAGLAGRIPAARWERLRAALQSGAALAEETSGGAPSAAGPPSSPRAAAATAAALPSAPARAAEKSASAPAAGEPARNKPARGARGKARSETSGTAAAETAPSAAGEAAAGDAAATSGAAPAPEPAGALSLSQITPVIRALSRETTPRRIFFSAVNHFGRVWRVDRCLAANFHSGQEPVNVVEFCAPGVPSSYAAQNVRLLGVVESLFSPPDAKAIVLPDPAHPQAEAVMRDLGLRSLLAQPLNEAGSVIGAVLLQSCGAPRAWDEHDRQILEALAEQLVLVLGHARLRSLLQQFTAVDERTGLLKVSSMLEVLVAECARAQQQGSTVSVLCLEAARADRDFARTPAAQDWMLTVTERMGAYLRPHDVLTRLSATQFVLVLPDTIARHCAAVFRKLRGVLADQAWPNGAPLVMIAGGAEISAEHGLQPEDIATDVLDRAMRALGESREQPESEPLALAAAG